MQGSNTYYDVRVTPVQNHTDKPTCNEKHMKQIKSNSKLENIGIWYKSTRIVRMFLNNG